MTTMQNMSEIQLYNSLLGFKRIHGADAFAALLRKLGVKSATQIDASRMPEVEMLCKAGPRALGVVEGEDAATGASDSLEKGVEKFVTKWGGPRGVDIADALEVVNNAPSLKQGLDRLAICVHARGKLEG